MTQTWHAPAKINLSLKVGPAGPDGRHPLDSLVAFARRIGDVVRLEPAPDLELNIDGLFSDSLQHETDNLILRAARLLAQHLKIDQGAKITLTKNLPVASGIGGGSADAAAALVGLNDLWQGGLSLAALAELGATLGADVPACVMGAPLRMTGTGETISPIDALPSLGIVLVNPLKDCPTGPVYQAFDRMGGVADLVMTPLPQLATQDLLLAYLIAHENDLESAAIQLVPEIAMTLSAIAGSPDVLLSRMSGSGATCFGLYPTLRHAQAAARAIKNQLAFSPVWVEADEINEPTRSEL
jgi:4-diphosphocytidyl-2-C-methyl-D-erythritol kinase